MLYGNDLTRHNQGRGLYCMYLAILEMGIGVEIFKCKVENLDNTM